MMRLDTHAADYCPTCGQPRERSSATLERFGLQLTGHNSLSFCGRSARLKSSHAEFLRVMLEKGRASKEFLLLRISPEAGSNIIDVHACRVRKIVRDMTDARVTLRTVWGWGYELTVDEPLAVAA